MNGPAVTSQEGVPAPRFRVVRSTRTSRLALGLFLAVVAILALAPFWGSVSTTNSLVRLCTLICLGQMWNLLAGYAGLVSIGQQAFIGIGAYSLVYLGNEREIDVFVAVALAACVCLVVAIPFAGAAFRRHGGYFAIGTWVLAEVCRLIVANNDTLGGGTGTSLTSVAAYDPSTRQTMTLWFAVAAGAGATLLVWLVLALSAGHGAHGDPRLRGGRGLARRARDPSQAHCVPDRCRRLRVRRRGDLPEPAPGTALGCVQCQLDGAHDLRGGDRRHWHHRGALDRSDHCFWNAGVAGRLRVAVLDPAGSAGDCRNHRSPQRDLGMDGRPLGPIALPHRAKTRD